MEKPWLKFYDPEVPPSLSYGDVPLGSVLTRSARRYGNRTATQFVLKYAAGGWLRIGGSLTYSELDDLVSRFATALYQIGVRKGDRVAVMLPNSPHFVIAFFAAMRLGAIVVSINPTYTARELLHHLDDSGAETIVLLNLFWPRLREIQSQTALKRVVVAYIADTLPLPARLLVEVSQRRQEDWVRVRPEHDIFNFGHLLKRYDPTPPRVDIDVNDTALFQYTGGTTGAPRAAMLTHRNVMANVAQINAWITDGRPGRETMLGAIPFFHVYGLSGCMIYGLHLGSTLVIVPNPRPIENVMRVIQHERCTLFPGVPAMYMGMVNHPNIHRYDLKSIRVCISGSAPLPIEVQRRFGEFTGGRLVEGYGLSEASPVTHCTPIRGEHRSGSMGLPVPDVEARLIDMETGEDVPFDAEQTGELCVRGPQVMKGYWNRPEENQQILDSDGWLRTGDICRADPDGFFYVVDRKKDVMNSSGFNVLPREVEEVLFMHPGVREAVVVGIPHPERGDDTVKAFIVPHPEAEDELTPDDIQAFCKMHLAPYKIPREVEFRGELPRTTVGKVLRRTLVEEEKQKYAQMQREQSKAAEQTH